MKTTTINLNEERQIIELSATVDHGRSCEGMLQKYPEKFSYCPFNLQDVVHCYERQEGVEEVQFVLVRGSEDYKSPDDYAKMTGLKKTSAQELVSCAEQHHDLVSDLFSELEYPMLFSTENVTQGCLTWLQQVDGKVYLEVNSCSNKCPGNWHLFRK